jgi:hypothetical protein
MKNECPPSRTYAGSRFDGTCPKCGASVGMTAQGRIKVHQPGVATKVVTGGGRIANYQ